MKKIIPVMLVALLLSACTTNATENKEKSVYPVTASMSYTIDLSNPSDVAEQADCVALVHIDQIEGADNYSTLYEEYIVSTASVVPFRMTAISKVYHNHNKKNCYPH